MKAGFAEVDITPPVGTLKIGWLKKIVSDKVIDPLFARIAVFENGAQRIGFVQLDTLSVRWTTVRAIRTRIEKQCKFPGSAVMVSATHNHAGPAVAGTGEVPRDEAYVESMVGKAVEAFGRALKNAVDAEIGFGSVFEFNVAFNRRVVMRDGTVRTHGTFADPDALFFEGPVDPEVAVLAARRPNGTPLGCLVNFACHPTHFGGEGTLSAGYPGALAAAMKKKHWPVTLFLNGPCGNTHTSDPTRNGAGMSLEEAGAQLADDAAKAIAAMEFRRDWSLATASRTVRLPYRRYTKEEVAGTIHGAQRFVDPAIYDRGMPDLLKRIRMRKTQPVEIQVLSLGDVDFAAMPAEYFVEFGLKIKEAVHPRRALVVSCANGMVGYVPTQAAFERGGYETTFAASSRMAPEAGDMMADAAIGLVRTRKGKRGRK